MPNNGLLSVFLGGTVGKNDWRKPFIEKCRAEGIDTGAFFNPVVPTWNEEARKAEESAKINADVMLFYIADPMDGENHVSTYSLVEAAVALATYQMREPIVVIDSEYMTGHAKKVMDASYKLFRASFPHRYVYKGEHADLLVLNLKYRAADKAARMADRP